MSITKKHIKIMKNNKRKKQAKFIRVSRKIHRTTGVALFIFFFFISVSGLLLGWKKHSGDLLLPQTQRGVSTDMKNWLPIDSLYTIANNVLHDSVSAELSNELGRIDIRQNKGIVKFIFSDHFWGIQLDGTTGQLLHVGKRHSDFIENIHDGSILDSYLGTTGDQIKVFYTTVMGLSLLVFTITGFWLWYGPKRMKKTK